MITNSNLHYQIIRYIIDKGFAPSVEALSKIMKVDDKDVIQGLASLSEYHGVVLQPYEPSIWVIHPFSLAPTNFLVKSSKGIWWGNCAWCSLGIAALLNDDVNITTRLAAYDEQIVIHITGGQLQETDLYVHFPIPMQKAWDNVIYTCSNILVFKDKLQINQWTRRHHIPKGDVQPISKVWEFSKKWYSNHLNPNWEKWTLKEAKAIFQEFHLTGKIWELEDLETRF
ncbi:MAG: alkylmercury lyase family protein [Flavisolibacter sp.]